MSKGTLEIHSQNILPIIKQWLYTDKDIFIRELISNSCDAITKRKLIDRTLEEQELSVRVSIDPEAKTLTIADEGIGMSEEELVRYLSQVAFSSAQDFVEKYQGNDQPMIGHFGLGFYSSFMVASKVVVRTKRASSKGEEAMRAAQWSCDGSTEYELLPCDKEEIGTEIILHLSQECLEYLQKEKVETTLKKYGRFLPCPLFLGETRLNTVEPLWEQSPTKVEEEEYLNFYRHLYPGSSDPAFWIHLNVDYPFHLKGILYFPSSISSWQDKSSEISLYSQRIFVSDHCRDILPDFLAALHGAIDSPDIPLNVSRSSLQRDATVAKLTAHISKKVADKLKSIFGEDRERFEKVWPALEGIVKYGMHQDEKFFDRVKETVIWKTSAGNYKTIEELTEGSQGERKIFYLFPSQKHTSLSSLAKEPDQVVMAHPVMDPPTMAFFESKQPQLKFVRCDAALEDELLDPTREDQILDEAGRTKSSLLVDFATSSLNSASQEALKSSRIEVEVKSLKLDHLPALVIIGEQERRLRDWMAQQQMQRGESDTPLPTIPTGHTLVLNSNHSAIQAIGRLREEKPELARELICEVYDLALLSQGELGQEARELFVKRSFALLEKLTKA